MNGYVQEEYPDSCEPHPIPAGQRKNPLLCGLYRRIRYLCIVKIKEQNMETIQVEIYRENGKLYIYLGTECSSGCKYEMKDISEAGKYLDIFIADYCMNMET